MQSQVVENPVKVVKVFLIFQGLIERYLLYCVIASHKETLNEALELMSCLSHTAKQQAAHKNFLMEKCAYAKTPPKSQDQSWKVL